MFGQPTKATFTRIHRVLSRVFERKKHSPPPPKKKLQYISNYIGKIIQTRQGQCTWRKYSLSKDTIVSQNALYAPDCISAHIHLKKFPAPPKKLVAFGHSELLPQTINPRLNPDPDTFKTAYFFARINLPSTRNQWIPTPRTYFFETALQSGLRPRPQEAG